MADHFELSSGFTLLGLAISVSLLAMMGFAFMASTTLLLVVASPLFLLFAPILAPAALLLAASVVSFAAAAAVACVGIWALTWAYRQGRGGRTPPVVGRAVETLTESGQRVKERVEDFGGYSQKKVQVLPPGGGH